MAQHPSQITSSKANGCQRFSITFWSCWNESLFCECSRKTPLWLVKPLAAADGLVPTGTTSEYSDKYFVSTKLSVPMGPSKLRIYYWHKGHRCEYTNFMCQISSLTLMKMVLLEWRAWFNAPSVTKARLAAWLYDIKWHINHNGCSSLFPLNAVRCRYNTVSFLQSPHNRQSIAHPWGRGIECLSWV